MSARRRPRRCRVRVWHSRCAFTTRRSRTGEIVRSVFAVDRNARTLTFAADIPEGCTAQLMRANFDSLAAGAGEAGKQARSALADGVAGDKLAILVSCTGRRRVMGQRTQDEARRRCRRARRGRRPDRILLLRRDRPAGRVRPLRTA
ncbi:FIST C-terminal domain-containing protein [Bradyrhizobium betae]